MNLRVKIPTGLIILIILLSTNFIYIIPDTLLPISCKDIAVVFVLIFFLYTMSNTGFFINRAKGYISYGAILIVYFAIAVMSAIRANQLYGQSILSGLLPQRYFISGVLFCISVTQQLKSGSIEQDELIGIVIKIAKIQLFIYYLQYLLGRTVIFLDVQYSYDRYGIIRLYVISAFVLFLLFRSYSDLLKGFNLRDLFWIIISLYYLVFIDQSRLGMIAVIIALVFGIVVQRRGSSIKIFYIALAAVIVFALMSTDFVQEMLSSITAQTTNDDDIRSIGKALLVSKILESPLIGRGYINSTNANAVSSLYTYTSYGALKKVGLNDNGIYSLTYMFGFVGLAWIVVLFGKMLKNAWSIVKHNSELSYILLWVYFVVVSPNITNWYFDSSVCYFLMIILALIENELSYIDAQEADEGYF